MIRTKHFKFLFPLDFINFFLIFFRWVYPAGYTKSIRGDIVLITGGGSGIGRLMSLKLADLGAKYLFFVASHSVKTRELSFAQFV